LYKNREFLDQPKPLSCEPHRKQMGRRGSGLFNNTLLGFALKAKKKLNTICEI
jgi:hypothetical protein